jgi:RNA polymerase sigma factor (sigma-70 family)
MPAVCSPTYSARTVTDSARGGVPLDELLTQIRSTDYFRHSYEAYMGLAPLREARWTLPTDLPRFLAENTDALGRLACALTPVIRSSARRVLLRSAARRRCLSNEIEDITQDVLEQLFSHDARLLRTWDPSRGRDLAGFVALISRRIAISSLRGRARHRFSGDALDAVHIERAGVQRENPEDALGSLQTARQVCTVVSASISGRTSDVFRMLFLEDRDAQDVSHELGISIESVYAHHHRLRRRLAVALSAARE